ncbi:MAG TPA: prepilin-type N-terminal cleavage/methylation domain-containing protein [Candidatus Saccharibacteria bacterium]|nr:prepilin-type N-terminal cleavage/methylation domain-containing protein [Candidatus Saccharibacteria bacterium]
MSKQGGFSAVELLITLFVAAGFLVAAYQLYNVILSDGGSTHQRASVSNIAYDYLRQYEAMVPETCDESTPVDNSPINIEGVGSATATVTYSCPVDDDASITKVEVAIEYDNDEYVSYATYARAISDEE